VLTLLGHFVFFHAQSFTDCTYSVTYQFIVRLRNLHLLVNVDTMQKHLWVNADGGVKLKVEDTRTIC
jgi:hypothetical protein